MTLEQQIADILDGPCGCRTDQLTDFRLRDCPACLPKRIAAAIEAATDAQFHAALATCYDEDASPYDYEKAALRALKEGT